MKGDWLCVCQDFRTKRKIKVPGGIAGNEERQRQERVTIAMRGRYRIKQILQSKLLSGGDGVLYFVLLLGKALWKLTAEDPHVGGLEAMNSSIKTL